MRSLAKSPPPITFPALADTRHALAIREGMAIGSCDQFRASFTSAVYIPSAQSIALHDMARTILYFHIPCL